MIYTEEWEIDLRKKAVEEIKHHLKDSGYQEFQKPIVVDNGDLKGAIVKIKAFANGEIRFLLETLVDNDFVHGFMQIYQPIGCLDTATLITVACHP